MGDDFSYGLNTLGPLCLWQCLKLKGASLQASELMLVLVPAQD